MTTSDFISDAEKINLSTRTKFDYLKIHAKLILDDKEIPILQRLPALRRLVDGSEVYEGVNFTNEDLRNVLWAIRREQNGNTQPHPPGAKLNLAIDPYLWDGIIMRGTSNLIVALPKIGKSRLVSQLIGHIAKREREFLGQKLQVIADPKVLIVGTDQPESDWANCFNLAGLLPDGKMHKCIIGLYDSAHPLHLDERGIEVIVEQCKKNENLIVVLDAYYKCVQTLGVVEKDAGYADPLIDLLEATAPYTPTIILIHHSGKANADDGPSMASRGHGQLPGSVSQTISLSRLPKASPLAPRDKKIRLISEGRGNQSLELLIEQVDNGSNWISHGDAEEVAQKAKAMEVISGLNDRQSQALDFICAASEPITVSELSLALRIKGENPDARARTVIIALKRHCLVEDGPDKPAMGDLGGKPAKTYRATETAKNAME